MVVLILCTPHPCGPGGGTSEVTIPSAPASARRRTRAGPLKPDLRSRPVYHASKASARSFRIRSKDSGVANSCQFVSGRQLGQGKESSRNLPLTCGSHASNAAVLSILGNRTTGPSTVPFVPGLHVDSIDRKSVV